MSPQFSDTKIFGRQRFVQKLNRPDILAVNVDIIVSSQCFGIYEFTVIELFHTLGKRWAATLHIEVARLGRRLGTCAVDYELMR